VVGWVVGGVLVCDCWGVFWGWGWHSGLYGVVVFWVGVGGMGGCVCRGLWLFGLIVVVLVESRNRT